MSTEVIPYEPYHPHLGYTLLITCIAWASIALYSRLALRRLPQQRIILYALAIGLPIYAEGASFLIYLLRPAPETAIGRVLSYIHIYYLQLYPIDSFLTPTMEQAALGLLITLTIGSLLRFWYGTSRLNRSLQHAQSLDATAAHDRLAAAFAAAAARIRRAAPPVLVAGMDAPLAFTTGLLRPRIYVSAALLDLLTTDEAMAVLCHEWAHVLRRDNLWNWPIRLLRDLICFLPGSYFWWRSLVSSQDEVCDAVAAEITGQPLVLARALVKVTAAWNGCAPPHFLTIASPFASLREPHMRVERMISLSDGTLTHEPRAIGAYVLAVMLAMLAVLPTLLGS